jgi:hypothetical protein
MQDNTVVSLAAIAAGVVILVGEMATGSVDTAMTAIASAAIGVGAGVSLPIGAVKKAEP